MTNKTLGFIGLGMMGGPMAKNLLAAGYRLLVLDTRPEALAPVVEAGGEAMASPAEIASAAETVLVSLPTPAVVEQVAVWAGGLIEGTAMKTYVDLSTTGPVIARRVAAALADKGVQCLDAPVSGGERGATAGTLSLMVSGPKDTFAAVQPILEVIGRKSFYIGLDAGMGQTVKVANNYLSATSNLSAAEATVMGAKSGLDLQTMLDVINVSSGRNNATEDKYPTFVVPRDFRSMRTELILKDITLFTDEAEVQGVPTWLASAVRQFLTHAVGQGRGGDPSISLITMIEDWAGVQVKGGTAAPPTIEGAESNEKPPIGFIGLGMMGGPMAMRLVDAGFPVTVFDVRKDAMQPFVDKGAVAADSPKAVADAVENVMVCLPIPDVVRQVALAEDGLIAGGKIKRYVDLSTTGAVTARAVAAALSEKGIACLDCPVSGGVSGAEAGTLSLMQSGDQSVAAALKPAFAAIGENPFFIGEAPGLGQTMKVANNYLSATANIACAEALVMGVKAGIDPAVMLDVINASSGRSDVSEIRYPTYVLPRDFTKGFKQRLLHKDVKLCMEEAAAQGVPMWIGNAVRQFLTYAVSQGTGDEVSVSLIKHIEGWAGVEVRGDAGNK